jgi:Na+(H+)/acetate symporter ActP
MHAGVWSLLVNILVTIIVSRVTPAPSPATVERIHGEVEAFVHGTK